MALIGNFLLSYHSIIYKAVSVMLMFVAKLLRTSEQNDTDSTNRVSSFEVHAIELRKLARNLCNSKLSCKNNNEKLFRFTKCGKRQPRIFRLDQSPFLLCEYNVNNQSKLNGTVFFRREVSECLGKLLQL